MKTKNSNNKMLPSVMIEPVTYDTGTLLSELTWHLLVSLTVTPVLFKESLNCLLFMHHFTFGLRWLTVTVIAFVQSEYLALRLLHSFKGEGKNDTSGGSNGLGRARDVSPLGPNSFISMQFLAKILQSTKLAHPR